MHFIAAGLSSSYTSKGGSAMSDLPSANDWLQRVIQRLSLEGFTISENVQFGGELFRAAAHRSRFELTKFGNSETFFVFAEFRELSRESARRFSFNAFQYAKASKSFPLPCGLFESVWCFAVGLVDTLDEVTAASVHSEPPVKHWAAAEIPVVYERRQGKLHFFEKTPLWGAAYYTGFRTQVKTFLGHN
jgi:hypothetical protein